eukprot:m.88098 g.88098  ORF g.88098 m.88098 type:complete len:94 (-) comp14527_c1_seq1:3755-4036(-)
MAFRQLVRMTRMAAPVRSVHVSASVSSVSGTKFSEKELAEESVYIRKHEAKIRELKRKELAEMNKDKEEILKLAQQATRPHVKELLEDLAAHI